MDAGKQNPIIKTVVVLPKTFPEWMDPRSITWSRELTLRQSHVARQELDLKNWPKLPLARRLGMPLRFKKWGEAETNPLVNKFAETMSIDPEFDCRDDIDIVSKGFKPTIAEAIHGGIEVVRDDDRNLYYQDIEALWEYVEQSFPYMPFLLSTQTEIHSSNVRITRISWEHGGNQESFVKWWRGWRARKRDADGNNYMYRSLECPAVGSGSKSTLGEAANKAVAKGGKTGDSSCSLQ
jgi:hypothetical protein